MPPPTLNSEEPHCFVGGSGVRIFDDELSDYGEIMLKSASIRIGAKVWCRRREDL